jgi:hypothetical protein
MDMRLYFNGPAFHWSNRLRFSLYVSNVLGGLDQLLHGGDHLHGWGLAPAPNGVLLTPTGFDPSTRRFTYDVNQRFGNTRSTRFLFGSQSRITLSATIAVGPSRHAQEAANIRRDLRRSIKESAGTGIRNIVTRYFTKDFFAFNALLWLKDSLDLSQEQIQAITTLQTAFGAVADSLGQPVIKDIIHLTSSNEVDSAIVRRIQRVERAMRMVFLNDFQSKVRAVLTPAQFERIDQISPFLRQTLTSRDPEGVMRTIEFGG